MGTAPSKERVDDLGMRIETDIYPGAGHVPIFGLNLLGLLSGDPINFIFNPDIMEATLQHTAAFCYSLLDCDNAGIPLSINESGTATLKAWPNPSSGYFNIQLPAPYLQHFSRIEVINALGQRVYAREISPVETDIIVQESLDAGIYHIVLISDDIKNRPFTGQISVVR